MNIAFEHLIKEYVDKQGKKRVLEIEAGKINAGSRTAIVGANGAGKSTLVNILAGIDTPTTGSVQYKEEGEWQSRVPYEKMTMVFQNPYLLRTTVERNIAYPLRLRGWQKDRMEKRVNVLLENLGMLGLRKQKCWKLSGGEIQKVALARALSFAPELLLLDEPTANIDPATTGEIEQMLLKINKEEGTTIVLITHNLVQAKRVCDQVIFLDKGKLIEAGDCEKMLRFPENLLTQRFVAGELLL